MPFIRIEGFRAQVYVPEPAEPGRKRHQCPDCCFCQECGEDRCQLCRERPAKGRRGRATCSSCCATASKPSR